MKMTTTPFCSGRRVELVILEPAGSLERRDAFVDFGGEKGSPAALRNHAHEFSDVQVRTAGKLNRGNVWPS